MKFFTFTYWFSMNPGALIPWAQKGLIFLIVIFFGLAIYAKYAVKNNALDLPKITVKRLSSFFITNGIIGLVLLFLTYERISFFSSRFWFLFWGAGIVFYLYHLDKKIKCNKQKKEQYKKEAEKKKYIP